MLKTISSITNALGALNYKGTWNASTNSPTLASGVGTKGDYYVVSVAGSTNLDGETLWGVGDWAVFNGSVWQRVEGGNTINATTVSASTSVTTPIVQATNSGGLALKNSGGTTQLALGAGGGDNITLSVATNITPANANVAISPTGTGTVAISPAGALTINPTAASTINNTSIGATTASTGKFSTVETTGKVGIGAGVQSTIQLYLSATGTDLIFDFGGSGGDVMYSGVANAGITAGENAAASILFLRKNTATSRSINAAGTINAAGLDYAEYMEKGSDFTIAKGDICGIDANGKLTNVFADAISFVVKSTNPSYVGGDNWASEAIIGERPTDSTELQAWESRIEEARQKVDRIAFAGQVPVNVTGATSGQYIIPVNNNGAIKGEAVSNPTFEQYKTAIGKVISVTNDTPTIIVKIA
jgi:hypothetical protein